MSQGPESSAQSSVSLKSDWSKDGIHPDFRKEQTRSKPRVMSQRPESSAQSSVSLKSDWSKDGIHPDFRQEHTHSGQRQQKRSRYPGTSGHTEQQDLTPVFQVLEEKIMAFMKNELQRLKRILNPDYQENFEKREEDESDAREGAFKMALHFLLKMDRGDLADKLREHELDVLCQAELKINLKTKYQSVFEGIPKQGSSALLKKIYTEVYITEGGSGKVNEEHEIRQIESRSKTPAGQEKPIRCSDIFKPLPGQDKPSRRVMTKGVAGIGKTISIQKYILDWAEGKDNKEIHFIFPLPFRELNLKKDKDQSLKDLLHHFFPVLKELSFGNQEKYNILFIFDGLDECRLPLDFQKNESWSDVAAVTSLDVLLTNLIKGNLLPSALLWITSRPAAASKIPPECVDLVTEIQGFNDSQKEEYFRKRISDDSLASRIISHITSSRSLHIMCHIPVFCWITACVLEMILSSSEEKQLPKTLTEMYTFFLIFQTKQKSQKYEDVHDPEPQWNQDLILDLGKLAYNQLEKGNLIFYEDDMRECGIDVREAAVRSGVCTQIFREESGIFQATVFCFIHLSIQEYLAALYVFLMMATKTKDVLSIPQSPPGEESMTTLHKNAVDKALEYKDGRFDLFLRFLLGLSLEHNQTRLHGLLARGQRQMGNDETISYIKEKIREVPSSERVINLFHCLNELNDLSLVEEIQSFLSAGTLSESQLSPGQWSALVFVLLTSDQKLDVFDLKKYVKSDEGLLRLKQVVEESQTVLLDSCRLSETSCSTLASVLCNTSSKVKKLDLSGNRIGDVGVKELCSGLKNPKCGVEVLSLSGCGVTGGGYSALASALQSNPSSHLEELDLRGNNLRYSEVKLLIDTLQDPACKLKTLRLLESDAADQACVYLTSILHENPLLETDLNLYKMIPGDSGVKQFCALLGDPHCRIKTLSLYDCSITAEGCADLVSAVASNPSSHLTELYLHGNNKLGDSGVKQLSTLLRNPDCKLQRLQLGSCSITAEGGADLVSALKSNPSSHLTALSLYGNNLGASAVKQLSALKEDPNYKLQAVGEPHRRFEDSNPDMIHTAFTYGLPAHDQRPGPNLLRQPAFRYTPRGEGVCVEESGPPHTHSHTHSSSSSEDASQDEREEIDHTPRHHRHDDIGHSPRPHRHMSSLAPPTLPKPRPLSPALPRTNQNSLSANYSLAPPTLPKPRPLSPALLWTNRNGRWVESPTESLPLPSDASSRSPSRSPSPARSDWSEEEGASPQPAIQEEEEEEEEEDEEPLLPSRHNVSNHTPNMSSHASSVPIPTPIIPPANALPNMAPATALPIMSTAAALPNMAAPASALPNMSAPISTFSVDSCMSDTYRLKYHKPRPALPFMTDSQGEGQHPSGEGHHPSGEGHQLSSGQLSSGEGHQSSGEEPEEPEEEVDQRGHTPSGAQRTNQQRAETGSSSSSRAAGRWNPVTFRGLDEHGYL